MRVIRAVGATQVSPAVYGWVQGFQKARSAVSTAQIKVRSVTASNNAIDYRTVMPHTYSSMLVHCVFSTKERRSLIRNPQLLWRYLSGISRAKQIPLVAAGGTANHVHLLLDLPPTVQLAQAMQVFKGNSSRWLNEEQPPFAWQQGYGAFGIGESQRQIVVAYIDGQAEHHKKWTFEQEFLTLLQKYGVQYDERFVLG
jgi:REP element-mobilizing transposase RayT